jgi:hypothetical protein
MNGNEKKRIGHLPWAVARLRVSTFPIFFIRKNLRG